MQLSIVVPVYKSADCLPELARRVQQNLAPNFKNYELILVNDDSPDRSWDVIIHLCSEYDFITGLNLRKNVGQDNAIMAGLQCSRGEVVVIMDDDLQHDPSDILPLYQQIRKGYDVVYASFGSKKQAAWKNLGSWFNDRVAVLVLGKPKNIYMSPFKAIHREVVAEISKYDGPFSYIDGLIFTITSNIGQIQSSHHPRFAGSSNYNLVKSIQVWLKLATNFSVLPLRMVTFLGGFIAFFSFMVAFFFLFQTLMLESLPKGWPSLIVTVLFLGGVQLIGIGVLGEYIGRGFMTQNKRPQFIVKDICGTTREALHQSVFSESPLRHV